VSRKGLYDVSGTVGELSVGTKPKPSSAVVVAGVVAGVDEVAYGAALPSSVPFTFAVFSANQQMLVRNVCLQVDIDHMFAVQ
jgi:hypothetical protein